LGFFPLHFLFSPAKSGKKKQNSNSRNAAINEKIFNHWLAASAAAA
jgi:hypothetical protein